MTDNAESVGVGLVGAGPWAEAVHAPMLAAGPSTFLTGVWARRPEAAERLAAAHGVPAFASYAELLARSSAVAFSVPPAVQAGLAIVAAKAGKAVLLEKPIAQDLERAEQLARVIRDTGVGSQVVFTWRYIPAARDLLERISTQRILGARGSFITGSLGSGRFATQWRQEFGAVLDLAPHVFDFLDAALGTVVSVQGHGDGHRWAGFLLEHEGGHLSEVSITGQASVEPMIAGVEVYTDGGRFALDANMGAQPDSWQLITSEFAATAGGRDHGLDVHRGLHIQRLVAAARRSLEQGGQRKSA
jgi:predicted dehydrogenase